MDVYFIRHGQTDSNVARRHQHQESELNELGKEQIKHIAQKVIRLKPTHLISSTQLRAVQSTRILIENGLDIIPDTHAAFEELSRSKTMVGQRYFGLSTLRYMWLWFKGGEEKDGEDYQMFLNRIKDARRHLESFDNDAKVVVISHAIFINVFLRHVCLDEKMSFWQAIQTAWKIFFMKNATIVHLRYDGGHKNVCAWHLISS